MKDEFIEQKLNQYAEAVKPGNEILRSAILELRKISQDFYHRQAARKKSLTGVLAAAACFVFVLSIIIYSVYNTEKPAQYYSLKDLTYQTATIEEVKSDYSVLLIDKDAYANARIYKKGDIPVLISMLYKTVGSGGLDEIVVLADIGGGLRDYGHFKSYAKIEIDTKQVSLKQTRQNGEYYTDAYFRHGDVDYYIIITSPQINAANQYISFLLN